MWVKYYQLWWFQNVCKLVQLVLCLQQRTLLIFRFNLAIKTIKLQNNKKCEQFYVSLAETFDMFYEKTLCLHQLRTVSNAQELGHIDFVFFRTQVSPTGWLNQVSHEMPWNYVFIFCCASPSHAKHFSSWRLFKNPEHFCVLPASQSNTWTGAQNDRILKKQTFKKFFDRFRMHG